jgi:hypothetical protein
VAHSLEEQQRLQFHSCRSSRATRAHHFDETWKLDWGIHRKSIPGFAPQVDI